MNFRTTAPFLALLAFVSPVAQAQDIFTYMAHWRIPRAAFQEAAEFNENTSAPDFEKLVADGTLIHWGIDEPFVHTATGHTHGSWFAASSLEGIDKAMAAFGGANPIADASEAHHDHLLRSLAHGGKTANVRNGYIRTISMQVKTGMEDDWQRFATASYKPVFDASVEDGTVLVWEISTEAIHAGGDARQRYIWYVTPDAAGVDKVNAALAKDREERPGPTQAMRAASDIEGHFDGLSRVHFQHK